MRATYKITVPRSEGAGPKSERAAKQLANRYKDPGTRLYTDQSKNLAKFEFVNREAEEFVPGTIKTTTGPGGVSIRSGELKKNVAPRYRKAGA
jgi:hypothetical protein